MIREVLRDASSSVNEPVGGLLLACLRAAIEDAPTEREREDVANAAQGGVDWAHFVDQTRWHRVAGQALAGLRSTSAVVLAPPEILAQLDASYFETLARNLRARRALDSVCGPLAQSGVRWVLLKGAALLETVYPDAGLRPMLDVDLLVPDEDMARAAAVLEELGYEQAAPFRDPAMRQWLWQEQARWPPLVAPDDAVVVELHRRLGAFATPLGFEPTGVWARAQPTSGSMGQVPAAEDLVVHLALHWLLDRRLRSEGSLGQLADIARVLRGSGAAFDWDVIVRDAQRYDYGAPLALALLVVTALFNSPVPADAAASLDSGGIDARHVNETIRRRVLRPEAWLELERLGPRTTPLRQLLPPRPRRLLARLGDGQPSRHALRDPYASWAKAAVHLAVSAGDVRAEVAFCRLLQSLLGRPRLATG